MTKKYTIEEFREKFDKAKIETLEKLQIMFKEGEEYETITPMAEILFNMQNTVVMMELEKKLFDEGE